MTRGRKSKRQIALDIVAERRLQAWTAYKNGKPLQPIAIEWEVDVSTIRDDVRVVLRKLEAQTMASVSEHRRVQLERLQEALGAIWEGVAKGEISHIQTFIRLLQEEAKLTGTYAPTKIDIERRIREMAEEEGFDPDEAVREADRIAREART